MKDETADHYIYEPSEVLVFKSGKTTGVIEMEIGGSLVTLSHDVD